MHTYLYFFTVTVISCYLIETHVIFVFKDGNNERKWPACPVQLLSFIWVIFEGINLPYINKIAALIKFFHHSDRVYL